METPKYQFHLLTWGGFYNEENKQYHEQEPGDFFFDTQAERSKYLNSLKKLEKDLKAERLCYVENEGFHTGSRTILHRVSEHNGEQRYTTLDLGVGFPMGMARYHLENKWFPGCNDYPFGASFDYETGCKVVQEWITGAFDVNKIR